MAEPIHFEQENVNFVAPGCGDLPTFADGQQIISCWALSQAELAEVLKSGRIFVRIVGTGQPPMSVHGITPFTNEPESTPQRQPSE